MEENYIRIIKVTYDADGHAHEVYDEYEVSAMTAEDIKLIASGEYTKEELNV